MIYRKIRVYYITLNTGYQDVHSSCAIPYVSLFSIKHVIILEIITSSSLSTSWILHKVDILILRFELVFERLPCDASLERNLIFGLVWLDTPMKIFRKRLWSFTLMMVSLHIRCRNRQWVLYGILYIFRTHFRHDMHISSNEMYLQT